MTESIRPLAHPVQHSDRPVVPTRAEVDALMKRCQVGVGGRHALDNAHSILADCYGTLGALMLEVERLRELAATQGPKAS